MDIRVIRKANCLDLVPIFVELEQYYFKEQAATEKEYYHFSGDTLFEFSQAK